MSPTSAVEKIRENIDKKLDLQTRGKLGQFMTNRKIAKFMAELINIDSLKGKAYIRILDPGAGVGSLSAAIAERVATSFSEAISMYIDTYEIDETMRLGLSETGDILKKEYGYQLNIYAEDFIEASVNILVPRLDTLPLTTEEYDLIILNPPYKKISSNSAHRFLLRRVGIETTNLYTAFWQLSIKLAKPGSHICAIVPRSFCNGTYFKHFRKFLKASCTIKQIHVFDSRKDAFSENDVLQENVIVYAQKDNDESTLDGKTIISRSATDDFTDTTSISIDEGKIWGESPDFFLFVPTSKESLDIIKTINSMPSTLTDLGLKVSTGPVVQFRLRSSLETSGGVPMLYCSSMSDGKANQKFGNKKAPPYIAVNEESRKWLVKNSSYLIIRRFSSKEEKRRIVSAIYEPNKRASTENLLGIDNKLNYIYSVDGEMSSDILYGVFVYLSCSLIDKFYRLVSGHTQVNSGDLRSIRYPPADLLRRVGSSYMENFSTQQESIDAAAKVYFSQNICNEDANQPPIASLL